MTLRRTINFEAALRDLRNERCPAGPVFFTNGRFDVQAIMREAVRRARGMRVSGLAWARRMAIALRLVWASAKAAASAARA